ncbi:carboxypeptidase regulatory-like domain-containing protein [bacterium]|nr:MAG: carboxypeptidase regulatory-like domain-containing protein [bacterium]
MDLRSLRVSIAGRVLDDRTGEPITDAVCSTAERQAATDERGVFLLRDAAPGKHTVTVTHSRYAESTFEAVAAPAMKGGALEPVEVRLKPKASEPVPKGARFEGDIRYADGSPAAYIPIRLGGQTAVTDAQGHYVFESASLVGAEKVEVLTPKSLNVSGA